MIILMIYHQNYITSQHSINLKNSKKLYDQLHKKDLHTFIIRKAQLQQVRSNSEEIASTPNEFRRGYYKSNSETKNKKAKDKLQNIPIIHKMNSDESKKIKPIKPIFRKNHYHVLDSKLPSSPSYRNDVSTRSKHLRPYSRTFKSQSPKIQSKKNTQNSVGKQEENKKKFWEFESYLSYIYSQEKIFRIQMNFDPLRKMGARDAWKELDINNAKLIENMMKYLLENIEMKEQENIENIKQICRIYFNNFEKVKMELILKEHYFKLFAFRLKTVFIIQRIVLYFGYLLADKALLSPTYLTTYKGILQNMCIIYNLIIKVIFSIQQNKKGKEINEAFRILRSVSEVEKKIQFIQSQLKKIIMHENIKEFVHIFKVFQFFLTNNYSYEELTKTEMMLSWKYLKVPPTPFLPSINPSFSYTLIIDLDETIIYFNQHNHILKYRPGLDLFLNQMKQRYQIILFTASSKLYADTITKEIQSVGKIFNYRLYKEHLTLCQGRLIKDIKRLGRDLRKTIIIDDLGVNFSNCKENGIEISSWVGDKSDKKLLELIPMLKQIADEEEEDVREVLSAEKEWLDKIKEGGEREQTS